jgi:hypothetical protein
MIWQNMLILAHISPFPPPPLTGFASSQAKKACPTPAATTVTLYDAPSATPSTDTFATGQISQPRFLTTPTTVLTFFLVNLTDLNRWFNGISFLHCFFLARQVDIIHATGVL